MACFQHVSHKGGQRLTNEDCGGGLAFAIAHEAEDQGICETKI